MYSRYPNYRFSGGVRVPENYSGNAFSPTEEDKKEIIIDEIPTEQSTEQPDIETVSAPANDTEDKEIKEEAREVFRPNKKGIRFPGFGFDIGKMFSGRFGFEELLLIALIFLISQNGADDDIILMLAILLFVG
ncbi:MAG: hypothetical protein E7679_00445 [Ruminococcaceae bacterium]|nr:hypothetical protein [Oscillospiraceae bacterium]